MQNRYIGDIGDFGKYGLLRTFCGTSHQDGPRLRLGVHWYLVPDETGTNDGKHIAYLDAEASFPSNTNELEFRNCDSELYDKLRTIIRDKARRVSSIRERSVLPESTQFYEEELHFSDIPVNGPHSINKRLAHRDKWSESASHTLAGCDLVFFDPDNGLEVQVARHQSKGPKYTYYDELASYWARGQSLVIYHHMSRQGDALSQINGRLAAIKDHLNVTSNMFALHYHRGTARAFLVIPTKKHEGILLERSRHMTQERRAGTSLFRGKTGWARHFDLVEY